MLLSGCCELLRAEDNSLLSLWDAEQQVMRKIVVLSVFYYTILLPNHKLTNVILLGEKHDLIPEAILVAKQP
jgi:hypothetical protein